MSEAFAEFRTDSGVFRGLPRKDGLLALVLAFAATSWALLCSAPGVPPELWEEVAAAAGLRPPTSPYPGLWRIGAVALVKLVGTGTALVLLRLLGAMSAGGLGALVYLVFRDFLDCASESHVTHPAWRGWVPRFVVFLPTLLLVTSAPVGRLVRFFGPETLQGLMIVSSVFLLQRFLRTGVIWTLYVSVALTGAVLAETPLGIPLLGFVFFKIVIFSTYPYNPDLPICNLILYQNIRWHTSGIFLVAFLCVTLSDSWTFQMLDGWEACGWTSLTDASIETFIGYARTVPSYAGFSGWFSGLIVCCIPYIAIRRVFVRCVQLERPLPYGPGLACLGAVLLCYSQFSNTPVFWFWSRAGKGGIVASPLLTAAFLFFSALAMALAMAVWATDLYCRSPRVVWRLSSPDDFDAIDASPRFRRFAAFLRLKSRWSRRFVPAGFALLLVGGALPFVRDAEFRDAAALVDDAVKASVDELADVRWIFTDGRLDAALELEAASRGQRLTALAMIASRGPRTSFLNLRDVEDESDELLLKGAASEALKSWILSDRPQLAASALQLGVEMFVRARRDPPTYLGLCARTKVSDAEAERARAAAAALEERLLDYYRSYGAGVVFDGLTSQLLNTIQWRLGRLLRFRAKIARQQDRLDDAVSLETRADALDEQNAELKALVQRLDWFASQKGDVLTPREGLRVALARPDFILASRYAASILRSDPNDADANFAMGMRYLVEKKWESSEFHLRRVLAVRPKEVAVINNLAIVCFRLGRVDEAIALANKAKALAPSSEAVADTLRTILKAGKER